MKFLQKILCGVLLFSILLVSFASCRSESPAPEAEVNPITEEITPKESETPPDTTPTMTVRDKVLIPLNNDFRSRTEVTYEGINGHSVTVYTFFRDYLEQGNNPNFSQALLIWQCIRYKEANPDEDVRITCTSFHFSIFFAACVEPTAPDYGHVKNLYDSDFSEDGYYRLSYLLVEAARKGIEVTVIGQLDAAAVMHDGEMKPDMRFADYFNAHLSDAANAEGKTVGDFMDFKFSNWGSYGDKAAADMMHTKTCSVSHYLDNDGTAHGPAVWTGSINIDGVNDLEQNGNETIQAAVIVAGHEDIHRVLYNYTRLMANYCGQEDIVPFRNEVVARSTAQIADLSAGKTVSPAEQIVYIGSPQDNVFELYFTPLGGSFSTWDTVHNPYIKYIAKLVAASNGEEHIEFIWNNVKYKQTFALADMIAEALQYAFENSANRENLLQLQLPGLDASLFDGLTAGENIGYISINKTPFAYHTKDLQLSYVENGVRYCVSVLNSLNFHEGSMYHQANTILVIKENEEIGNDFYVDYALMLNPVMNENISERRITR